MRKINVLRFAYSVVSICFLFLIASCSRDVLDSGSNNDIEPDSEFAHTVSIDEAEEQLLEILNDLQGIETRGSEEYVPRRIVSRFSTGSPISTKTEGEIEPYVHVFNFEDSTGFAIMSGDDRVPALLALTFDGELCSETEVDNPGLIMFLANMEEYYKDLINGLDPETKLQLADTGSSQTVVYGPWRTVIYPMVNGNCKVQWGQSDPYNMYCPVENGKNTLTGCVATAVAQLMSAYEYPSSYGGYTFDWKIMNRYVNKYSSYSYGYDQIARLMQQLGLSHNLNMSYGLTASGAYSKNIPGTLRNFGFSNGGSLIDYSTDAIVSELKSGYYTLISGFSYLTIIKHKFLGITIWTEYNYSGGHQWLAHGLMQRVRTISTYNNNVLVSEKEESLWYPLCNFGWNGSDDGYYLSGAFDTNTGPAYDWDGRSIISNNTLQVAATLSTKTQGTSHNYQFNIQMITGIRK